ncbi:MAG: Gfo/Idh/MocA family oxidoreductase [archaeon]
MGKLILVVGCGSIGERHIKNLKTLNIDKIIAYDTNQERLKVIKELHNISTSDNLDKSLSQKPDAALICTPPSTHIPLALRAVENNSNVFIEKPMSHNLEGIDILKSNATKKNLVVAVGYNFRFQKGMKIVKDRIKEIGKILSSDATFGQYLPSWRPWQNYKESYTAKKALGGGIILDGSHEIDYMRWLLGEVSEVFCMSGKVSSLEVETEDHAEITLKFKSNAIGRIHLDFYRPGYTRKIEIVGEKGVISWNFEEKTVKIFKDNKTELIETKDDTNEMYLEEMKEFLEAIDGKKKYMINADEGKKVLEIALAAKESSEINRIVKIG